jgi:hypothetical protein
MIRWQLAIVVSLVFGTAFSQAQSPVVPARLDPTESEGGFLLPPVDARSSSPRIDAIPSLDPRERNPIRPVRADLPEESPRPVRMTGVRTPEGERGVSASRDDYDRSPASTTPSNPDELFTRSRRTKRGDDEAGRTDYDDVREPARGRRRSDSNRLQDLFDGGSGAFESDDCFCHMISPISNPFLFEDPRVLTEVKPLFLYQKIPGGQPEFAGGSMWFFGGTARMALSDRWSLTLNKLGAISVQPGGASAIPSEFGFAELWLGPKFTFLRNIETQTVAAGGLIFQLPIGGENVFQNTGDLSLVPYVSAAKSFAETQLGTVNGMTTLGYSFSTNSARSDYLYWSGHLDLDINNMHKFYPLIETNYFVTTTNGNERPAFGFEGRDLINFGGNSSGSNLLTAALGMRYKISERSQLGFAYELPIMGNRDLFNYRFTVDFILRF